MGEAKRKLTAALASAAFPGGPHRCPKCLATAVGVAEQTATKFYAPTIAICARCKTAWEPLDEAQVWDRSDPHSSFSEPCDNCAFRHGSNEQEDRERWRELIGSLKGGAMFYCHKGTPLAPGSEHGFDYPADRRELRICRGYLNALNKWLKWDGPVTAEERT